MSLFSIALGLSLIVLLLSALWRRPVLMATALCTIATVCFGFGMHPAFAQAASATVAQPATDTAVVTVPLGTWLASYAAGIEEIVVSLIMGLIAFACRKLPAAAGAVIKGLLTQQLVERAIAFGFNTVQHASADAKIEVNVRSEVLANALNYAVQHAPEWFLKWVGGPNAIRDHIIALLPVDYASSLAHATPTATNSRTTNDPVKTLALDV